jgi:hypothetical protein
LEKQKTASHQGGGFNPPAEIYLVSFPTTHRRELSFPIKGTLALPLPGCQTRIRVVPDVAWDRSPAAAKGNDNLCHSRIDEQRLTCAPDFFAPIDRHRSQTPLQLD